MRNDAHYASQGKEANPLNPITTDLLLGFENDNIQTISVAKGDTERKIHCELHDSLVSYMVEDTTFIFLKGVYPNGELIPPVRIWSNWIGMQHESELSIDGTELDFYLPQSVLQIPGITKCTLVFVKADELPEFDEQGTLLSDNTEVLSSDKFNICVEGDVYDDACYSSVDKVQVSALLPLVIHAQGIETAEEARVAAESERQANEQIRIEKQAQTEAAIQRANTISEDLESKVSTGYFNGRAATIQVGTVTTVEPGQGASVTNSGDDTDAVFDFKIPKGRDGNSANLPDITNGVAGVVIPDGSTVTMEEDGTIHCFASSDSALYIDSSNYLAIDYGLLRQDNN